MRTAICQTNSASDSLSFVRCSSPQVVVFMKFEGSLITLLSLLLPLFSFWALGVFQGGGRHKTFARSPLQRCTCLTAIQLYKSSGPAALTRHTTAIIKRIGGGGRAEDYRLLQDASRTTSVPRVDAPFMLATGPPIAAGVTAVCPLALLRPRSTSAINFTMLCPA